MLFVDVSTINNTKNDLQISNEYIPDEIYPFCEGTSFSTTEEFKANSVEFIQINLGDKEGWYRNFYQLSTEQNVLITDQYKKRFTGTVEVTYSNGTTCKFDGEMRLTGDLQDHIRNVNETSLDIQLLNGNILGITNFKLFYQKLDMELMKLLQLQFLKK